ncbi:glycogen debranching N-terminal domain-containing protein [Microbacterium sp. SORGH_AS_0888]|uniref:glycogen debranching N-terminal domain-containing protein n=1 Tax=Microbacterium sp. SORGH_AS_0888 TaxID=3041791 RepID=UPI0027837BB3|nr:glycogen debranching N-terminal domain-containing protein [Microbacterium sp. SORGH_AS_0888]MDQ1129219.1 glycogen debranching enzyme [Microbacterium sp. SORGH_AS_0888]
MQPLLHDQHVILRAPVQAWQGPDGSMGDAPIHGLYLGDIRLISHLRLRVGGASGEHVAIAEDAADRAVFVSLVRQLDDADADPHLRAVRTRTVTASGLREGVRLESALADPLRTTVEIALSSDLAAMDLVKSGRSGDPAAFELAGTTAHWGRDAVRVAVTAEGARLRVDGDLLVLTWDIELVPGSAAEVEWRVEATDARAVVTAPTTPVPWSQPSVVDDDRLRRWVERALGDLDALRLETTRAPGEQFLAAGAPWFFTLFGRDSLWAARMLLPLGTGLAASTLRVLARFQGRESVSDTAEQPGKIMHELRRDTLEIPGEAIALPPLYYGTVDATPLWVCLLHDAWRAGMPDAEVAELLPHLEAALSWMRDFGDSDGDGLLEYVDETGHGLSNQGWKDSGDSVQWRDGTLAQGPIALCEVQAYAYEAARHGADLLEHFGRDGTGWRDWASRLRAAFHDRFWVDDPEGAFPAIALDADKRPVDSVTSNIGHLLGTGLLDAAQARLVARRLLSPALDSGYGLRTLATDAGGYWPLGYHRGTVWAHDTAIAIRGLAAEGIAPGPLIDGLLSAAAAFDYRMPELHGGDARSAIGRPVPYPAACRPQAWSAAAAVTCLDAKVRNAGES